MPTIEQLFDWLDETDKRNGLQNSANMENKKEQPMMGILGTGGAGIIATNISSTLIVCEMNEKEGEGIKQDMDRGYTYLTLNEIHRLPQYYEGKPFKCKGKHQYREVDGVWICECGRKLE